MVSMEPSLVGACSSVFSDHSTAEAFLPSNEGFKRYLLSKSSPASRAFKRTINTLLARSFSLLRLVDRLSQRG